MEIDRAPPKRSSSAPLSPTTVPKQKKVKGRTRSTSPVPSRQPKQVQDMRNAVRLNVLEDFSSQRAADEANAASASIKAGLSAKITKSDVERYGKEYRDAVVADLALSSARINLDRALRVARRDESVPEVQIARGIFENIESSTKQRIGKSIDKLQLKRPGNPKFSEARVFTDNEEEVMAEIISQMSLCGFPFGDEEARGLIAELAAKMGRPDFVASTEFMRGFQKRTNCIFSARNASNVARERARAADPKTRKETFAKMDAFYANLHETEPDRYPWPSLREMPAERKINFDETASDSNIGQERVLASTEIDRYTLHRCFQVGYDKMPFHVTIVVAIKGDGTLLPPMVIHSAPGQEHPSVNHSVTENIYVKKQDGSGDYENVDDIIVDVSTNGSMTKELFPREIVATRAMVVKALTGPLKAAASAAAEKKKKKRRNQGVPDTRTGLGVNEALKYLDEKHDAKDRKDAEKEAAAVEREKIAAEKFQLSFEKRLPEVFEDLASKRPTPIDDLALTKLVPLVKYLQEKHASDPQFVVRMAHGKDEFKPKLLEEYERVKTTKANYRKYAAELSAARDARA